MSTRACIARKTKTGFKGVYRHWDGYPTALGETLFTLYNGHFKKSLPKMLKFLIDDHPSGWSTINGADFTLKAGYDDRKFGGAAGEREKPHGPECYCHGTRSEEANQITEKTASGCGCEWAYALDEKTKTMFVLSSYCGDGKKMIGMFGMGDPNAEWKVVAEVKLDGDAPDFDKIEEEDHAHS